MRPQLFGRTINFSSTVKLLVNADALKALESQPKPSDVFETIFRGIKTKVNDCKVTLEGDSLAIDDGREDVYEFEVDPSEPSHINEDNLLRAAGLEGYIPTPGDI